MTKRRFHFAEAAACFEVFQSKAAICGLIAAGCVLALSIFGTATAEQIIPAESQRGDHATTQLGEGMAAYERGDYATAVRLLLPLADQGVPLVQFTLGVMYANGKGTPQDYGQAAAWYRKAADQGYDEEQGNLGAMYAKGEGVPQDYAQAVNWYSKAADQGNVDAQASLGWMYSKGLGVSQDFVQAVYWSRMAADQGNAYAEANLGTAYENGEGVDRDLAAAANWLRKAADQGSPIAQRNLGRLYENGQGVAQDYTQAASWYGKAATQGDLEAQTTSVGCTPKAMEWRKTSPRRRHGSERVQIKGMPKRNTTLGRCTSRAKVCRRTSCKPSITLARLPIRGMPAHRQPSDGCTPMARRGPPQDFAQAGLWFGKAADQGNAYAQANLSWLYANGQGVAQDDTQALMWSTLALARAEDDATRKLAASIRDAVAAKMTPDQVAEAKRMAGERFPK